MGIDAKTSNLLKPRTIGIGLLSPKAQPAALTLDDHRTPQVAALPKLSTPKLELGFKTPMKQLQYPASNLLGARRNTTIAQTLIARRQKPGDEPLEKIEKKFIQGL